MALQKTYPADFERLWKSYPKWPSGRSKKEPSYKAFAKAKKELDFTEADIAAIEMDIERRKRDCLTWQEGNKFGPVMFATYFNQHLWNEPYEKAKPHWSKQRPEPEPKSEHERCPQEVGQQALRESLRIIRGGRHVH